MFIINVENTINFQLFLHNKNNFFKLLFLYKSMIIVYNVDNFQMNM